MLTMSSDSRIIGTQVKYNPDRITIEITHKFGMYEIDAEMMTDSAAVLDWIFQIAGKSWGTPEVVYDLVHVINEACRDVFGNTGQGIFCPNGVSRSIKWSVASPEALNRERVA